MNETALSTIGTHEIPLPAAVEKALILGDLSSLIPEHRLLYYHAKCRSLGLNPLTKPFAYLTLNGKLVLYALKDAKEQLRKIHGISLEIVKQERQETLWIVHVRARTREGRTDEDMGFADLGTLKGEALGNAMLKAITKAKSRVTLSICGLGMIDESEVDAIPGARVHQEMPTGASGDPSTEPIELLTPPQGSPIQQQSSKSNNERGSENRDLAPETKLTAADIAKLLDLLKECYQDQARVDASIRQVMQIPAEQSWNAVRLRHTMTQAQYQQLQHDAKEYARLSIQQQDDDWLLHTSPDTSESPGVSESTGGDGRDSQEGPSSSVEVPNASAEEKPPIQEWKPTPEQEKLQKEAADWGIKEEEVTFIIRHNEVGRARTLLWKARRQGTEAVSETV